jgi:hypothetical protein
MHIFTPHAQGTLSTQLEQTRLAALSELDGRTVAAKEAREIARGIATDLCGDPTTAQVIEPRSPLVALPFHNGTKPQNAPSSGALPLFFEKFTKDPMPRKPPIRLASLSELDQRTTPAKEARHSLKRRQFAVAGPRKLAKAEGFLENK